MDQRPRGDGWVVLLLLLVPLSVAAGMAPNLPVPESGERGFGLAVLVSFVAGAAVQWRWSRDVVQRLGILALIYAAPVPMLAFGGSPADVVPMVSAFFVLDGMLVVAWWQRTRNREPDPVGAVLDRLAGDLADVGGVVVRMDAAVAVPGARVVVGESALPGRWDFECRALPPVDVDAAWLIVSRHDAATYDDLLKTAREHFTAYAG